MAEPKAKPAADTMSSRYGNALFIGRKLNISKDRLCIE
jgi:hypothetical protein